MHQVQKERVIYLIRHAKSQYNKAQDEIKKMFKEKGITQNIRDTPEYKHMKFQANYEDCDIVRNLESDIEIQKGKYKIKDIHLDLIVCSPMRRTLQTCSLIFKDHKSKAPVIVDPLFREAISSRCDIGSRIRESMKEFPQFDYSLIEHPDYWYVETLKNENYKQNMLDKISQAKQEDKGKVALNLAVEYIKDLTQRRKINPAVLEEAVSSLQLQKDRLKQLLKRYKSIAVVTHNYNIQTYIGRKSPNCCVFVYKPEYFDMSIKEIPDSYI